jgi:cell division protein FtsQ
MRLPSLKRRRSAAKSRILPRARRRRSATTSAPRTRAAAKPRMRRRSAPKLRVPEAATRVPAAAVRAPAAALHALPPRARLATVGMVAALAVLGGLYFFWLRDSTLVRVEHVQVSGVSGGNAQRIEARLTAAARGMTTLNVDDDALREAVAAFPAIRAVSANADFPHTLRIVVSERVPVAALTAGRRSIAVASDATLLPGDRTRSLPAVPMHDLPIGTRLTNLGTLRAVAVLAAAPPGLRARVDELDKGKGGLRATLRGGGTVVFGGPTLLTAKWMAAAIVLRDPRARGARYLDVRIPRRPVAGGLPPAIDPNTGERIDPTTGEPVGSGTDTTTDPLSVDNTDPNAGATGSTTDGTDPSAGAANGTSTDGTGGGATDGTGDPSADGTGTGSGSQDSQFAGPSP